MSDPEHTLEAPSPSRPGARVGIPGPQLIVALECDRPRALSSRHLLSDVHRVALGRGKTREASRPADGKELELRIPDRWMSTQHGAIERSGHHWVLTDAGSRNGTRVNGVTTFEHVLADGDLIEVGHTLLIFREGPAIDGPPDLDLAEAAAIVPGILTLDATLAADLGKIPKIAQTQVSMLVLGESGTGKELLARATSRLSKRSGEFVAVNCGGLPGTLVESELFGYRKGAFSGADQDREGLVRAADRGTLFLDEIGDLPASSQATLLRVLQEREVRPLGATQSVSVDVRLISATHRDLEQLVDDGEFRRDLYARIAAYRIQLPPIRDRRDDLGILVGALLERLGPEDAQIDLDAARTMFRYDWPLNIRELENCLTTALALAEGGPILREHLPEAVREPRSSRPSRELTPDDVPPLAEDQRAHREELIALFREHRGNVSAVARATGKARTQVQRWIKRYAIDPASFRR